jgi:hypothetical protein
MDNNPEIANNLIKLLSNANIKASIFKIALTGSVYIHFSNPKLGKLRVGDHKEKNTLGYRWQIRTDIKEPITKENKGHKQFLYPVTHISNLINHIKNYYNKVTKADPKPLGQILAEVDSPVGRERLKDHLKTLPYPHFEPHPTLDGFLIRIEENGKQTIGMFVEKEFVLIKD